MDFPGSVSWYHPGRNPWHTFVSIFTKTTVSSVITGIILSQLSAPSTFFYKTFNPEVSYWDIFEVLAWQDCGCNDGHVTRLAILVDLLFFFFFLIVLLSHFNFWIPQLLRSQKCWGNDNTSSPGGLYSYKPFAVMSSFLFCNTNQPIRHCKGSLFDGELHY